MAENILSKEIQSVPGIYLILNTVNGKCYIGSAINVKARIARHLSYLRRGKHHSPKLQRSVDKYGYSAFQVNILYVFNLDYTPLEMLNKEDYYIQKYNSISNGYNILTAKAHIGSFKLTDDLIAKAIETKKKKIIAIDRFTGDYILEFESITEASKYYHTSTSNISRVCNGDLNYIKNTVFVYSQDYDPNKCYIVQHHMKNKHKPIEQIQKMRLNCKKNRKVYKYDLENNLISEYISRADCERCNDMKKEYLRTRMNKCIDGYIYTYEIKDIV